MPEQKTEIVHKHLDEHVSVRTLEKQYNADRSMICHWVKRYISEGESSFVHKGHPENKFAALHVSKNLSEMERVCLLVAKLEIENERLKRGCQVNGAGANKAYVTIQGKNIAANVISISINTGAFIGVYLLFRFIASIPFSSPHTIQVFV